MAQAHSVSYPGPRLKRHEPPSIAFVRDPRANHELRMALFEEGYDMGDSLLHFPRAASAQYELLEFGKLERVDCSFARPGDLLFQTTRPPLSDGEESNRRRIEPANTDLERAILLAYQRYFDRCCRPSVKLSQRAAQALRPDRRDRASVEFALVGCAIQRMGTWGGEPRAHPEAPGHTMAYLLRVDALWPGGPGFVGAFGMNAISTLAWCRLLRTRHSMLLQSRGLTMVDLTIGEVPKHATNDDWARSWQAEVVAETREELPPLANDAFWSLPGGGSVSGRPAAGGGALRPFI